MDSYAEFLEDIWLHVHAQLPEKGVYVDCGCYHPEIGSNTAFLRDRGWTGIGIDANNNLRHVWEKKGHKFVHAAIGNGEPIKYAVNASNPGWSRAGEGPVVQSRTLDSILEENGIGKIDVLSMDLEGMEYDALKTLNLSKHQPTIIIAEFDTQGIGKDYRVLHYLLTGDYIAMHMTEANIIYRLAIKKHFRKTT